MDVGLGLLAAVVGLAGRGHVDVVVVVPGPLLYDCLSLRGDDLLGAPVELGVLDQAVPVGEAGAALLTAVGLLALEMRKKEFIKCLQTLKKIEQPN